MVVTGMQQAAHHLFLKTKQVKKINTDPVVETSWIDKKFILHDATVQTIIEYLEDNYGYKVVLKDTAIGNKKMEGTFSKGLSLSY